MDPYFGLLLPGDKGRAAELAAVWAGRVSLGTSGREENAVWPTCFENLNVSRHVHELLTSSEFPKLMLSRSETERR